jgi:heme-degrading monooxygenase HmoA
MVTIVTHVKLREGTEHDWDAVMQKRMTEARKQPGWIGGQLLQSDHDPGSRVIVGTWQSRADWERWHHARPFVDTRHQLNDLGTGPADQEWHDVVLDVRKDGSASASRDPHGASPRRPEMR